MNQLTLDEAQKKGMEVEPGDELVFQIFYRDEDAAEAKAQDDQYGDILKLKTFRRGFGRIAAQTAKQVILQRTRDAERENVFNEYKDRKNEIVTGIARRFERGNIIVDLGRAEAVLPVREQVPRETYRAGDRVQAYVLDVLRESKGPQIILSPRLGEPAHQAVRDGGPGDCRGHRRHRGRGPRARRPREDRRQQPRLRTWTRWAPAWA